MKCKILLMVITIAVAGCGNSIILKNAGKTVVSTGVAAAVGGPYAGGAVLISSIAYDEIVPVEKTIAKVESKEQAVAYVAESLFMNALYAFVVYLIITLVAVPFIHRRGYNNAKKKYK